MELRQLRTFLAIADERHFGRAAGRLHLAQSSVSEQLRQLERELGVTLVARSSHHVALTEAGAAFADAARRLLADANRAVALAQDIACAPRSRINVGFNPAAAIAVVPAALVQLEADHPNLTVRLREMMTGAQLTALANGDIDLGFVYGRPPQGFSHRYVQELPLVVAVGETHPWAGRDQVRFADLAAMPCVLPSRETSPGLHDAVVGTAVQTRTELQVVDEVDDANAIALVARTRDVVAFTSAARAPHAPAHGLSTVSIVDPTPTVSMYAVWRTRTSPVDAFVTSLERAAQSA